MLVMGNHYVILDRGPRATGVPHVLLPASVVELCHVPVRSVAQFVVKIATQHLARGAAHRHFQPGSVRQRAIDALKRGEPMTTEHLFGAHAVAPGSPDVALASAPTVDNGDEPPFLADIALRYTPAGRDDPLPVVPAAVERLVRRIRRGRDGGQPAPPGPAIAVGGRPESAGSRSSASTRALTAASMAIGRPHSRAVSPGHLFVASMPILPPSPETGEAKSR